MQTRMIGTLRRTQHLNWRADQLELAAKAIRENTRRACSHPDAEPVDLLLTGERVAWVCPDCNAELPAGWIPQAKGAGGGGGGEYATPARRVALSPVETEAERERYRRACECPDETRDTVWVHVPERATWVTSYCAACGRGTGTLAATGSVTLSGSRTAALSGTGTLSAKAIWDDVAYASEAFQHFAQLARVGRERCIGYCPMCEKRDRQHAADESMRQWIEEGRWEQQ